jgi:predicted nucleic acid-binding protein
MDSLFVDTDVILDLFVRREPHHKTALRFFSFLKNHAIEAFTSAVSVANTYYVLTKIRNRRYGLEKIRRLMKLMRIAAVDQNIIEAAIRAPYKDFEDSIQYHCALTKGLTMLITRNVSDYPKDQVKVLLPDEYMTIMELRE